MHTIEPASAPRRLVALLVALAVACGGLAIGNAAAAQTTTITDGSLTWGVKQSWRNYAGTPMLSGGLTQLPSGEFDFPLTGGTFDDETGTTTVSFAGSVRWQSHWYPDESHVYPPPDGYDGPLEVYVLDVTLTDPQITISPTEAVLTVEAESRSAASWEMIDYGRVPIVTLDVDGIAPTVADEAVAWSGLPAALTSIGAQGIFSGFYATGLLIDRVSFTYDGVGGPPLADDNWAHPGGPVVTFDGNGLVSDETLDGWDTWWIDRADGVVHYYVDSRLEDGTRCREFRAYDLDLLQPVGDPYDLCGSLSIRGAPVSWSFIDPATNRVYYRSTRSGETVDAYLEWDPVALQYVEGTLDSPVTLTDTRGTYLGWDEANQRAVGIVRTDPTDDYDDSIWSLKTFTRQPDGSFVENAHTLPSGPSGFNQAWYNFDPFRSQIAADGSLILQRNNILEYPGAVLVQRIIIDGDNVNVEEIPGTDFRADYGSHLYEIRVNDTGRVTFVLEQLDLERTVVAEYQITDGSIAAAAPPLILDGLRLTSTMLDPTDGTLWGQSAAARSVTAVKDGEVVFEDSVEYLHPDATEIVVDSSHDVYALSNDGAPLDIGVDFKYGFARFTWAGYAPTVTTQPESASILAGESTSLTAAGGGTPAPSIRWQSRIPGAFLFTDIDGANGEALDVDATADDNGIEYRAVLTNPTASVVTDVATLEVLSPPQVVVQPLPATAAIGGTATFQVVAAGNPEPTAIWQSDASGSWDDLTPTAGVEIDGGDLTLTGLSSDDDGTSFRAQLTNDVGTAISDVVNLTVTAAPPGDGEQQVTVEVLEPSAGEFAWSIDGTDHTVTMNDASDAGDHWASTGEIVPIVVSDTRSGGPQWSVSGQISDFTGGVSGSYLGWTPKVTSPGGGATAGDSVASGFVAGDGLSVASTLASAADGHDPGSATVGADLDLRLPIDIPAGTYEATLTITALS